MISHVKRELPYICNLVVCTHKYNDLHSYPKVCMVIYRIEKELISTATKVIFAYDSQTSQHVCLKMWLRCKNEVYDTLDLKKCTEFQLEGLAFNRQFAPDVYLGIVEVINATSGTNELLCGPLIEEPGGSIVKDNCEYAIVMKRLDEAKRLDHFLTSDTLHKEQMGNFLGHTLAQMHKKLELSPVAMGTPARVQAKAQLNCNIFAKIWEHPPYNTYGNRTWFKSLDDLFNKMSQAYQQTFERRHHNNHIKRCHSDLKANNMWVYPANQATFGHLILLDCVDFNPNFYHIDTLSDIAMLAIDLEMHQAQTSNNQKVDEDGEKFVQHFLDIYLQASGEDSDVWPLLEYYMTEKAMVCAYNCILYDKLLSQGEKYLNIVFTHSKRLSDYLFSQN